MRELSEETGHLVPATAIGPAVAVDSGQWQDASGTTITTTNWYFFTRAADRLIDLSGQDARERINLLGHRWWTVAELRATRDLVFPVGLAALLRRLLGWPQATPPGPSPVGLAQNPEKRDDLAATTASRLQLPVSGSTHPARLVVTNSPASLDFRHPETDPTGRTPVLLPGSRYTPGTHLDSRQAEASAGVWE